MKRPLMVSALATTLTLSAGFSLAADQVQTQDKLQTQQQDQIYGSQLMTQQERNAHLAKMRAAKTAGEREEIRNEHHMRMLERAKNRGLTLPDKPPAKGGGIAPGGGGKSSGRGKNR